MFDTQAEAAALGVFIAHHANAIINALQLHAERMNAAAASALAAYEQGQQDPQQRKAQDTSLVTNNGYRQMADLYTSEAGKCQQIINEIQHALNDSDGSEDLDDEPAEPPSPSAPSLDAEEARLLRSYADGPRVWDAAAVFEIVMRLADKGMIARSGLGGAYALTDAGRRALTADMPSPRQCLYVFETSYTAHGYIPSMVTEGKPGHALMTGNGEHAAPWYWGHDLAQARAIAEASNAKMGLSPADVIEIVASSHRASQQR
jgi:hypothetical protein